MIALLGSSGYIGSYFKQHFDINNIPYTPIKHHLVYDREVFLQTLKYHKIEFLINCAGYTGKPNVDACESNKPSCYLGNVVLPDLINHHCSTLDIPWGHISSGCIYNGYPKNGYSEEDIPNFTFNDQEYSYYSGTKSLAESKIKNNPKCYIWRLRIPFTNTNNPRNYITKLINYPVLLNCINSITDVQEFVQACISCRQLQLPYGIYNLTNPYPLTTSDITRIITKTGMSNKTFQFFESYEEFAKMIRTPRSNCTLNVKKAISHHLVLSDTLQAVERAIKTWRHD